MPFGYESEDETDERLDIRKKKILKNRLQDCKLKILDELAVLQVCSFNNNMKCSFFIFIIIIIILFKIILAKKDITFLRKKGRRGIDYKTFKRCRCQCG